MLLKFQGRNQPASSGPQPPRAANHVSNQPTEMRKPARLQALTGLRCFAAINVVLFHFSNPQWFGALAPVVNAGYASVSYFILLSGYVLAYNYNERARNGQLDRRRFWEARFTRLYPIYLLSLLLSYNMIKLEWGAHTHGWFWAGCVLTPLLLQGWFGPIATFLNTPAWTMSAEAFYYFLFPWMAKWKAPKSMGSHLRKMFGVWMLGLIPGVLYIVCNPDGVAHPDRWTVAPWLQMLKYTPLPHFASFIFGVLLADLDRMVDRTSSLRLYLGLGGFTSIFFLLWLGSSVPYAIIHDGLLMPLFACVVLGLAGHNWLSSIIGCRPLVFVGEGSYCLYLLHFNLWNLVHNSGVLQFTGLIRFDPWLSYVLMIALALGCMYFIEKPAQKVLRSWLNIWR